MPRSVCLPPERLTGSAHFQVFSHCAAGNISQQSVFAACISLIISRIGSRSIFFLPAWKRCACQPIRIELAFQQWRSPGQSDEDNFAFTDATVISVAFRLLHEDYHNRSRARKSYIYVIRELGTGLTDGLLLIKLSIVPF